jgi:predicted nuclease of predicted toxin-antitoxin system
VILWIDAQLSPALATWISINFQVETYSARYLGFHTATDLDIFLAARNANAVVMTKDSDFVRLLDQHGPPQIIWMTCGNTSNAYMRKLLQATLLRALEVLQSGEPLVEISDVG